MFLKQLQEKVNHIFILPFRNNLCEILTIELIKWYYKFKIKLILKFKGKYNNSFTINRFIADLLQEIIMYNI